MIKNKLDDLEDYHLATQVLERIKSGQEKVYSANEVREELGLDNNMVYIHTELDK
jgi:RHH-type rel operon transcriptional repressor/antitoxin RelB